MAQLYGQARLQTPVHLEAEVDVLAHGLAHLGHAALGVIEHLGVVVMEGQAAGLVQVGVEVAERGEALLLAADGVFHQLLLGLARGVVVDPDLVPALAAQQPVDRHLVVLAGDVVQGHVDGGDGRHDGGAPEVAVALHVLPVVLNIQRVLPHQIALEHLDGGGAGGKQAPGARLADAVKAVVGEHLGEDAAVGADDFYIGDDHLKSSLDRLLFFLLL